MTIGQNASTAKAVLLAAAVLATPAQAWTRRTAAARGPTQASTAATSPKSLHRRWKTWASAAGSSAPGEALRARPSRSDCCSRPACACEAADDRGDPLLFPMARENWP